MGFLLKKEYRLGLVLTVVFGLFLWKIDQTSEQLISRFSGVDFHYESRAFLKMIYLVLLAMTFAFLSTLHRSENASDKKKGKAFNSFVNITVFSFFPGWIIHLFYVVKTIEEKGSFMQLEDKWWIYNLSDLTMVLGFLLAGFFVLRPAIHNKSTEK